MTKIKICGLRRMEDITIVNELQPEYIGFVFYPCSRRYIKPEEAARLREKLSPGIRAVGVFVDASVEMVSDLIRQDIISIVQLHGRENAAYISELRERTDDKARIIKAELIHTEEDLRRASGSTADSVLLDAGLGAGKTFDWQLLRDFGRPYFLAGGLTIANVSGAVRTLQPYAVDVSSGVETDGYKDPAKVEAFITAVREADAAGRTRQEALA
ncbi:phosphoribosylanthranilate isomerase [Oribacterium sp. HCP28S3_H8]|uniref:phosphoribosylanthranilate isomerase n=1 Tax=Oribacterium sp. HCP28S3_H8 TaxID=3438945 RepID=UPI003F8B69B8